MDAITLLILWLILSLSWIWVIKFNLGSRRDENHPPGPKPLPIIGNLHQVGNLPHKSLAKLAGIHGPVMYLELGQLNTLVISSSAAAKQVLQKQDLTFSSRSIPEALLAHNHVQHSVVFLPSDSKWRNLRRILHFYIFSANRLDSSLQIRHRRVQDLIGYCTNCSKSGAAVEFRRAGFKTFLNLLFKMFFSKDLTDPFSDSEEEFTRMVLDIVFESSRPNVVQIFPVLRKVDPQGIRHRTTSHIHKIFEVFERLIRERVESRKSGSVGIDFLDDLLSLCEEAPEEIDIKLIRHLLLDLFLAGTDTTSTTLEWAMTELLRNPWTLRKAQSELAEMVGRGKQIEEADVARLPYLQCILKETLRMHPAVPLLVPREVEQGVDLLGYIVPKRSQVLINAWTIGHDENIWKDPSVFKPERFLESKIDIPGRDFQLVPFGGGRRMCAGMSLAVRMIPLVLGSLLNVFDWELEGGIVPEELDMEEKFGFTLYKAHPLRAIPIGHPLRNV